MNNSIYSLAYLQYTYEVLRKDILDLYVPMFCKCLLRDNAYEVDFKRIKEAMNAIYGIDNITYDRRLFSCLKILLNTLEP